MILSIKPAKRAADKALIGMVGPSGSGKTFSALSLAKGLISNGGKIVVVDTEGAHGRALQYADMFDFLHAKLEPPYTADRFREATLEAISAAEGGCVILDSCSAEHEDSGGALEQHGRLTGGNENKNMMAWGDIRPAQRRWLSVVTKAPCHMICCFRADDKTGVEKNDKGKWVPVSLGWQAVGWKRWPYELQISVLLSIHKKGVPIIDGFEWGKLPMNMADLVPTNQPLDEQTGRRLAKWLDGGEKAAASGNGSSSLFPMSEDEARAAYDRIQKALKGHGNDMENLKASWDINEATIGQLPASGREKLGLVYEAERAKIEGAG